MRSRRWSIRRRLRRHRLPADLARRSTRGRTTVSTGGPWGEITPRGLRSFWFAMTLRCSRARRAESLDQRHRDHRDAARGRSVRRSCRSCPAPTPPRHGPTASSEQSSRRATRGATASVEPRVPSTSAALRNEPGALGSCQRRSLEPGFPFRGALRQPFDQVGIGPFRTRVELGFTAGRGLAVPGTDILADVAAKDPAVRARPRRRRRARLGARSSSN